MAKLFGGLPGESHRISSVFLTHVIRSFLHFFIRDRNETGLRHHFLNRLFSGTRTCRSHFEVSISLSKNYSM